MNLSVMGQNFKLKLPRSESPARAGFRGLPALTGRGSAATSLTRSASVPVGTGRRSRVAKGALPRRRPSRPSGPGVARDVTRTRVHVRRKRRSAMSIHRAFECAARVAYAKLEPGPGRMRSRLQVSQRPPTPSTPSQGSITLIGHWQPGHGQVRSESLTRRFQVTRPKSLGPFTTQKY